MPVPLQTTGLEEMNMNMKEVVDGVLSDYSVYVFDCDGVLWRGHEPIPQCGEMIERIRRTKRVLFATNNSLHSVANILDKLDSMNITGVTEEDIICPANTLPSIARRYLSHGDHIAVIGSKALQEAMNTSLSDHFNVLNWDSIRVRYFNGVDERVDSVAQLGDIVSKMPIEELPAVMTIGYDVEISYLKIAFVTMVVGLREKKGLRTTVLQSNGDVTLPTAWGVLPGAGALFSSYKVALTNFQKVDILDCGKPEAAMALDIIQRTNVDKENILMIGDNLFTDILFGERHLGGSCLVLTGVHGVKDVDSNGIVPSYWINSAALLN